MCDDDVGQFKRIKIPLMRKIYPQLIANKIVNVQPLLGPTGLVYYLRHKYSTNSKTPVEIPVVKPSKYRQIDDSWEPAW